MVLTGKCKEDFIKYLFESVGRGIRLYPYKVFRELEPSMQWGVYIDFFDSAGINIGVQKNHLDTFNNWVGHPVEGSMSSKETRQESQIAVIKKANEIYNLSKKHEKYIMSRRY